MLQGGPGISSWPAGQRHTKLLGPELWHSEPMAWGWLLHGDPLSHGPGMGVGGEGGGGGMKPGCGVGGGGVGTPARRRPWPEKSMPQKMFFFLRHFLHPHRIDLQ